MESFAELWELCCDYFKTQVTEVAYNVWLSKIEPVSLNNDEVVLKVNHPFQRSIILDKYKNLINEGLEKILGFPINLEVITQDEATIPEIKNISSDINYGSEYEFSFDTFIIGPSNKFAHAASKSVAQTPATSYNPLFIYGGSGLGKTHLLFSIKDYINKHTPAKQIVYVKGEEFTNDLIDCIKRNTTSSFREKYRQIDVLLVDDIQFIGGKESTQEEFFHTFNSLYSVGKQIVLTSDRPPREIKLLEDRLRSRFESGLLADIQPPDFETRIAIIRRKAELLNIIIPEEVAEYLANRIKNNVRQLEGVVKKLKAYKQLDDMQINIIAAQKAISDILNDDKPAEVTIEKIINEVSRTFCVAPEDIKSKKRSAAISNARQVSIYIVREITQLQMEAIGEEFGNRDHSTVVYTLKQVAKTMNTNPSFKEKINEIIRNIRNS